MNAKIFYPAVILITLLMIGLSLVWPQGLGQRSPGPFGHAIEKPDYFRMVAERDARQKKRAAEKAQRAQESADASAAAASLANTSQAAR